MFDLPVCVYCIPNTASKDKCSLIFQYFQVEKLREKIAAQRERRRIKDRYQKVKTLGESDCDEDSASAWVKKSRLLEKEKALAEKNVSTVSLL